MKRRERREFHGICEHLAVEDPRLARLLSEPVDRTLATARLVGRIMLWTAAVLLVGGLLCGAPMVFGLGVVLIGTWWLPPALVGPSSRPRPGA